MKNLPQHRDPVEAILLAKSPVGAGASTTCWATLVFDTRLHQSVLHENSFSDGAIYPRERQVWNSDDFYHGEGLTVH